MADLKNKILGLASAALVCTGMAYGQAACSTSTAQTNLIRAEGTTELLGQMIIACSSTASIPTGGTATVQVFVNPSLPVTSKVVGAPTSGSTEAILVPNGGPAVQGTVSGSTVNFGGIPLNGTTGTVPAGAPACPSTNCYFFTISNIRVNATSLAVGSGTPPSVTLSAFISGSAANITPSAISGSGAGVTVGFAQNGLATSKLVKGVGVTYPAGIVNSAGISSSTSNSGANNFVVCNANSAATAFVVQVNENFASAFKDGPGAPAVAAVGAGGATVTASAAGGSPVGPGSEQSQVPVAVGTGNAVVAGTRIAVNVANVPANVTLYVPVGQIVSTVGAASAVIQLTNAAPGAAFSAVTGTAASGLPSSASAFGGLIAPISVTGGAGSANFEVIRADTANLDQFYIPVFVVNSANAVPGSSTAITVSVNLAPVGSTAIPNFAVGSSTTTLTGSAFNLCTTSMLFPFVTNQLGFDTGIAISNTSTDPFGTKGATPQSGTCTLNFYGNGAPTPNNVTTANVPSGTTYSAPLSSVAAGFQGYIIAQCQFQFAHGFAFITDGVGVNGGLSQGYLAGIIPDTNQKARAADPLSVALAGQGESLGQ